MRLVIASVALILITVGSTQAQDGDTVPPVDWTELTLAIPDSLTGLTAGDPLGGNYEFAVATDRGVSDAYSFVEQEFYSGSGEGTTEEISIRIMDTGKISAFITPLTNMVEYSSPSGSLIDTTIGGQQAWIISDINDGETEHNLTMVLVAQRYIVWVEGNHLTTSREVSDLAQSIDYEQLLSVSTGSGDLPVKN